MWFAASISLSFFFFNDTATTEIYTLSLHDALPIWWAKARLRRAPPLLKEVGGHAALCPPYKPSLFAMTRRDRKSTRLNSSHLGISYAVFCLKKKHQEPTQHAIDMKLRQYQMRSGSD